RFYFLPRRRRHTRSKRDWSSDVCSSDLVRDIGPEMLDDDFDFLADVRRMQVREPHDLPRRRLRIHECVATVWADARRDAGLALLLDLERRPVRLVSTQHVEDETFLDRLPHRIHVK